MVLRIANRVFGNEVQRLGFVAQLPTSIYTEEEKMLGYGVGSMTAEGGIGWEIR